ncbi:hypothetical protein [Pseudomonas brassicacearum]|uniref:hypothetical protein n=1 Tax=Pseudomonas brassicacearum TaxID=930166 RepID=UPI00076170A2|nr:hypothetical protein [Pseudomonas brassicacearum]
MREIDHPWTSPTERPVVAILDNGHIYVLSDAAADADGAPNADIIDRKHGQLHTSLRRSRGWLGLDGSEYVDALTIPYFVLPGNWKSVTSIRCTLGDIAKLSVGEVSIFAIYADVGGDDSIGEASVRAIIELGGNPWRNNQIRVGLDYGVTYEIIPGSAKLEVTRSFEEIQQYGRVMFQ